MASNFVVDLLQRFSLTSRWLANCSIDVVYVHSAMSVFNRYALGVNVGETLVKWARPDHTVRYSHMNWTTMYFLLIHKLRDASHLRSSFPQWPMQWHLLRNAHRLHRLRHQHLGAGRVPGTFAKHELWSDFTSLAVVTRTPSIVTA